MRYRKVPERRIRYRVWGLSPQLRVMPDVLQTRAQN